LKRRQQSFQQLDSDNQAYGHKRVQVRLFHRLKIYLKGLAYCDSCRVLIVAFYPFSAFYSQTDLFFTNTSESQYLIVFEVVEISASNRLSISRKVFKISRNGLFWERDRK